MEVDEDTNHVKLSIKDINYRATRRSAMSKIEEMGSGFLPLMNALPHWIEKKAKEFEK